MPGMDQTTNILRIGWATGSVWMVMNGPIWCGATLLLCVPEWHSVMSRASTYAESLGYVWKTTCTSPKMAPSCLRRRVRLWRIRSEKPDQGSKHGGNESLRFLRALGDRISLLRGFLGKLRVDLNLDFLA